MIIVQIFLVSLLVGPILWGIYNWLKYRGNSSIKSTSQYNTLINSAVLYAVAFNLIFFLQEVFLVLGKKALGLKAFLYHNDHNWVGEHPMADLMQGSGALAIFIIGLACLVIYRFIPPSPGIWKLFTFWMAFHGLIQSIPQVMVVAFDPETDVGEALVGYLGIGQNSLIVMAIISMVSTVLLSNWSARQLLQFAPGDVDLNDPKAKLKYIQFIAVGAGVLGSFLIIPFRIFPMSQATTPFVVFVFSIPWTWASAAVSKPVKYHSNSLNKKIEWKPIVFLLLLLVFFRWVLAPGIEF
jgi:hypothetical protein